MKSMEVTVHYLEILHPENVIPKRSKRPELRFVPLDPPRPEWNRYFYHEIGKDWTWVDRLSWTDETWQNYANQVGLETWVLYAGEKLAGYAELDGRNQEEIEIVYFGLLPEFTGQGLGAHLLTVTLDRAWDLHPKRVWVHTCSLDHPAALNHYQARGFQKYREEKIMQEIPD